MKKKISLLFVLGAVVLGFSGCDKNDFDGQEKREEYLVSFNGEYRKGNSSNVISNGTKDAVVIATEEEIKRLIEIKKTYFKSTSGYSGGVFYSGDIFLDITVDKSYKKYIHPDYTIIGVDMYQISFDKVYFANWSEYFSGFNTNAEPWKSR